MEHHKKRKRSDTSQHQEATEFTLPALVGEAMRQAERDRSEQRFERLADTVAVESVLRATRDFQKENGLRVTFVTDPEDIPADLKGKRFKYTQAWGGALARCRIRLIDGESVEVVLVRRDGTMIGYGVASRTSESTEIEIIDVDYSSRRRPGLAKDFKIGDKGFQVGVGHVVAAALIERCACPIRVDATTGASRYVFKSLGFSPKGHCNNPCILEMRA